MTAGNFLPIFLAPPLPEPKPVPQNAPQVLAEQSRLYGNVRESFYTQLLPPVQQQVQAGNAAGAVTTMKNQAQALPDQYMSGSSGDVSDGAKAIAGAIAWITQDPMPNDAAKLLTILQLGIYTWYAILAGIERKVALFNPENFPSTKKA